MTTSFTLSGPEMAQLKDIRRSILPADSNLEKIIIRMPYDCEAFCSGTCSGGCDGGCSTGCSGGCGSECSSSNSS